MTLARKRPIAQSVRRTATLTAVLLGITVCASAMSLHFEVPAESIAEAPAQTIAAPPVQAIAALPAQDEPSRPVRIAGGVAAGQIISRVNPTYPEEAKASGVEGTVVLHAIIARDGTIKNLAVISGPPELQTSAIDAVKQWVYRPYLLNGEPVEVDTTITVNYSLAPHNPPPPPPQPTADDTNGTAYQNSGAEPAVYNVGGSVRPPVLIYQADPQYTEAARKAKLSGNVVVAFIVGTDGKPYNVQVVRGLGNVLDEKAVEAVQQYRFKPATRDGEPVAANLKVEVNFQIF